ncbi:MAG: InlB B-repeat-containing protein [Coriobacteriia bacterium]|nr:InlB B-repeat-containing protein [Coriobacteriia bacterium]
MTDAVQLRLINSSAAEAWRLTNNANHLGSTLPLSTISLSGVVVITNNIPASGGTVGDSYSVVFAIREAPDITVTVYYTLYGSPPIISFASESSPGANDGGLPLVIEQQVGTAAHVLNADEIRARMTVWDEQDGDLKSVTGYTINGSATASINTGNVGVYQVEYTVIDSDEMQTTATRAIVITDGRYIIEQSDNLILGARNFVILSADVDGSISQVRNYSRAAAYEIDGTPISVNLLTIDPWPVTDYQSEAEPGDYQFTWVVDGRFASKTIIGTVSDADVIFPGGNNDQYAITARNFTVNLVDAQAMIDADSGLNAQLIIKADVKVYRLVDGAPEAIPYVIDSGGFMAVINSTPGYILSFGAKVGGNTVITTPPTMVSPVYGRVSQGNDPVITALSPLEVWIGPEGLKPAGAILPSQYSDLYEVAAFDIEDGEEPHFALADSAIQVTHLEPTSGVILTEPGLYTMQYAVTDSDHNTATAHRLVVVNDGNFMVGDGRVLYATSFVTRLVDVTGSTNPSRIEEDILSKSKARLYDGTTGIEISIVGNIDQVDTGGYHRSVGTYQISITALDTPTGAVSKTIIGEVVDAEVIGPTDPPPFDPVTYVYGTSLMQTISEAESTAAGGDSAILAALKAGASRTYPAGPITHPAVTIIDLDDYVDRMLDSDHQNDIEVFRFTVSDVNGECSITLTITVGVGGIPVVTALPKPLEVLLPVDRAWVDSNGDISVAKLMQGVTATDAEAVTVTNPEGDVIDQVVITIFDVTDGGSGVLVNSIPADRPGIYEVTYSYTDEDHNTGSDTRAVIVNDGRYIYDSTYILEALSFVIRTSDVRSTGISAQLRAMSNAKAWTTGGQPRLAAVADNGGYRNTPNDYNVIIQVSGHADLQKTIIARVIDDGDALAPKVGDMNGANGEILSIVASNFCMNAHDANALVALASTVDYDAMLAGHAQVMFYDRTSAGFVSDTAAICVLLDDGGFADAANQPLQHGDHFMITFGSLEDPAAQTTIIAFVDNGYPPVIVAPSVRLVWTGEPSDKPADAIYYTDWTGMNGVSAYDSTDGDITSAIKMGLLDSSSSPSVFIEGTPVSLDIEDVFQEISYQVTDSDHNTVTVTVLVMVSRRAAMNSDYILLAMSFIETVDNITANGTGSSVILGLATAKAWRIRTIDLSEQHLLPIPVNYLLEVEDSGGYKAVAGEYPIIIGLADEPGYDCSLSTTITAKVIDQDVIGRGPDNFTDTRYVVAANHVRLTYLESAAYVGMTDTVTELLIERAFAEAWVITDRIETFDACVLSNQIGDDLHPLVAGGSYQVVFAPIGISGVSVTVIFEIDNGERPVINFIQEPLVFTRTDYSYALTEADLKAAMEVLDAEDGDLLNQTTVVVAGGVSLNQQNVGVWKVDYSVTDSHNNTATASRAVVIDDGRYIIDKADNIIIGARDFVVKRTGPGRVDGSEGQARSLSYAEAYSIKGVAYTVNWIARPSGYVDAAEVGTYIITWTVSGHSVTKTINAYVTDADTLDPGGKDSAYAIAASDFRVNLTSARAILITGDAAFIFAANAQVFKLIDSAPEATLIVEDRAGFTDTIGSYQPIIFCIASIPISVLHVGVTGTVSQRTAPVISLVTPIDVWVGDPDDPERPVDSILPVDYSDLFGVTADDAEDGDITASIVVSSDMSTGPVNLTQVGMYRLHYDVEDSDGNHPDVLPTRIVVVNDGRYVVGDGRILVARAFVTKVENVTDNPAIINQEILGKSYTSLYDGATGEPISSTEVSVLSNGGYRKEVGTYNITVAGVDVPSGYLYKNIVAEVVDADLVVNEPEDERSDSYYVFGNHITIRISEAATIIGSGDKNSSLLLTLQAGARKTQAGGTLLSLTPIVVDDDGFDVACGIYNVTIADPGLNALLTLSVTVVDGNSPVVSAVPIPLEIIYDPNNLGYVNRSQMMYGVTASDREDGDITGSIVINPDSFGNEVLPVIELRAASVTKITYSVTDSDGNVAEISRALIVNDGSIVFDECYIIQAYSFVIESSEVSSQASAQILERSEAKAFSTDGTEVSAYVADTAGFSSAQGAYHPLVGIIGYADLVKMVTAKVLSPGTGGGNGETYAISARGFRINLADAYVLQTASDTDYQQTFLSRSGAQSYLRNDYTLAKGGTSLLADDSGFRSIDFAPEGDPDYPTIVAVKFWVDEDHSAYVWVNVVVSNGNHPWLEVPALKVTGLNSEFGIGDYRSEVYYGDSEDSIDNLTLWHDTPVDTSIEGIYQVNYKVTDSEGNETTGIGYVLVGPWAIDRDYAVSAWSFVTTVSVVAGSSDTDELILQFSHAKALKVERDINGCVIGIDSVAAIVRADGDLAAIVGSYPHILIGISDELLPVVEISARVIDRDAISNKPDEDTGAIADTNTGDSLDCSRYVVGANNATISFAQAGQLAGRLDADTKAALIEAAKAVGYVISDTGSIDDFTVDVTLNSIGQEVGVYAVTFAPLGVQGVSVTVLFTVAPGYLPELAVDGPLVLDATEDSVYVSLQQLLDGVSVSDSDSPEISIDDVVISAGIDTALPIDQSLVGVKQVIHSVADPIITVDDEYGNKVPATVSVSRAVVINDGRFVVDDDEGDGGSSSGGVIVGAKNFVVSVKDPLFAGTVSDAIALAFAEAYNFDCEPLVVELASALPLGFAAKQLGVYSFTFRAVGYSETTVSVTGEIVDSDVVDLGQDPYRSKYALIASDYAVDVAVADTMNNDADFVNAASARAIKLLPQLGDVAVLVHDTGGFEALVGTYPIAFGITGYTQTERSAVINGMVTNGSPAALYVRTPIELALGTSWDNSVAMSDVAAIDPGVGDITSSVTWFSTDPTRAVDTSRPGIYQVTYTVTGNNGSLVSAQRCVVVNDGRYHVGSGRILEARSFVIRSADVASDSIERINQLLTGTEAQAYNGETGAELFPAVVSIHSTGGYNSAVGEYQVTVRALDDPTGYIDRQVIAKVVDADVIGEKPALPTDPSGTRVYVYGNNVTLYVSQVEKILNDASLLLVLQAEACVAYPSGELSTQDAVVVSKGGFEAKSGSYTIKVADSNLSCQIELILTVIDDPESEIPEVPAARHKVEFNANGGRLTGPQAIYVQEPATTIPYLPSTPVRNGYTFLYWATSISGGTHFTAEYIVTGNMVVYAQWKVVEAPKPPTPPGPVIVNPPTTVIVVPPVVTPAEPDDLPVVGSVVVTPAPVVISTEPGWALFNLLSVVLSGLLFVYILVLFMVGRKGRRRDSGDTQDTAPSAQTDNDFASSKRYRQASILKILASAVLFAEGLLVLLTTQDFSLPMQMIDRYSLIMALLLVAQACIWAVSVLLRRRSNAQFMQNESVVF